MAHTVTVTATFVVQASSEAGYEAALAAIPQGGSVTEDRNALRFTLTAVSQEQTVDAD